MFKHIFDDIKNKLDNVFKAHGLCSMDGQETFIIFFDVI